MNKTANADNKTFVDNIYLYSGDGELVAIVPVCQEHIVNPRVKNLHSCPVNGMIILPDEARVDEMVTTYAVMSSFDANDMHQSVEDFVDSTTVNARQAEAMKRIIHGRTDSVLLDRINTATFFYGRFVEGVDIDDLDPEQVIYDGDNPIKAKDLQ